MTAGSFDDTHGLTLKGHVFTSEKGRYYEIPEANLQYTKFWNENK